MKTKKNNMTGDMIKMGVGNLVGISMISATSGMVNDMHPGTAKSIAGMAPALQSTALMGANLGMMKKSMGSKKNSYF